MSTRAYRALVIVVGVTVLGLAFGAAVQQLGAASASLGGWTATAAQVSAPWLVLPFVIGATQRTPRRAAVLALLVTLSALLGYFAMTYSPLEIHPWSLGRFLDGMIAITTRGWLNPAYILGGIVFGPAFGVLGHRWRFERSVLAAALVVATICLEPLARAVSGRLSEPTTVWTVEVAVGIVIAGAFAATTRRRHSRSVTPEPGSS